MGGKGSFRDKEKGWSKISDFLVIVLLFKSLLFVSSFSFLLVNVKG